MTLLFLAALCALTSGVVAAKEARSPIGPDAVWPQAEQYVPEIRKQCSQQPGQKFPECFAAQMAAHAPAPAVEFAHLLHNDGYLRDFRETGRVDVASVAYPFRANENEGWLLVNGSPAIVDIDDFKKLPQQEMKSDPSFSRLTAKYPNATLAPGDRAATGGPLAVLYPDGSQEFIAGYKVVDGCRACAVLGRAFFGFDFNAKGRFVAASYLGFEEASSEEAWPLHARAGQKFALSLKGTGWSMDQAPAEWIMRASQPEQVSGSELWSFEMTGAGTTQMALHNEAGSSLVLRVMSAPGLRR